MKNYFGTQECHYFLTRPTNFPIKCAADRSSAEGRTGRYRIKKQLINIS